MHCLEKFNFVGPRRLPPPHCGWEGGGHYNCTQDPLPKLG